MPRRQSRRLAPRVAIDAAADARRSHSNPIVATATSVARSSRSNALVKRAPGDGHHRDARGIVPDHHAGEGAEKHALDQRDGGGDVRAPGRTHV